MDPNDFWLVDEEPTWSEVHTLLESMRARQEAINATMTATFELIRDSLAKQQQAIANLDSRIASLEGL